MTDPQPRLRMFAGPNGSGKSTIKEVIPVEWLGVYINPDEIEKTIRETGGLPLADFEVQGTEPALLSFLEASVLLARVGLLPLIRCLRLDEQAQRIDFGNVPVNSY